MKFITRPTEDWLWSFERAKIDYLNEFVLWMLPFALVKIKFVL